MRMAFKIQYFNLFFLILVAACSSTKKKEYSTFNVEGDRLVFEDCKLYKHETKGRLLLYDFKKSGRCTFIKTSVLADVFHTEEGTVVPLGVTTGADENCQTKAVALVKKAGDFYLSNRFYARDVCEGQVWPEQAFRSLASRKVLLPTKKFKIRAARL